MLPWVHDWRYVRCLSRKQDIPVNTWRRESAVLSVRVSLPPAHHAVGEQLKRGLNAYNGRHIDHRPAWIAARACPVRAVGSVHRDGEAF